MGHGSAGLVLRLQPSGHRSWNACYRFHSRPRWYHIGDAASIGLADARRIAAEVSLAAAQGRDPHGERQAQRGAGTFRELADRYLVEYAKRKNKSWRQARSLVEKHLLPRWGQLSAKAITRADVRHRIGQIEAPSLSNQVLAAASAVFTWAVRQEVVPVQSLPGRRAARGQDPRAES